MCGIAGLYRPAADLTAEELESSVGRMAAALRHRGPDAGGTWIDPAAGVGFGHRRLSIIDLSPNGSQPMVSQSGRFVIVFNGEIYNFEELRPELLARGHRFRGRADTEVLLTAIEEWGLETALQRTAGMFALGLWDRADRVLYLARDRIGEKPLYYGWLGGTFVFGSELKALRALEKWQATIDQAALTLLLRYNYIPAPYSIYRGIRKLEPGTIFAVPTTSETAGAVSTYWSLREVVCGAWSRHFPGSEADAAEVLEDLLRRSIRGQMIADVPLGAFLSGGIDSSAVVALMQAQSERPVRTFTIGFREQAYDEARYAKAVATHLGTDHTELYVSSADALAVIPRLPSLYDEPFADVSQIPTYLVCELARRSVTVSLSGDGGDELFGGYNRYGLARSLWRAVGWLPRPVRLLLARGIGQVPPDAWERMGGSASRLLPPAFRPVRMGEGLHKLAEILRCDGPAAMYHRLVSHWKEPVAVVRDSAEPKTPLTDASVWSQCEDYTEQMMYLDSITYLPDDILVKVDRASMGVSLESRIPLLDHRIVEFAWSLPLSMKIRGPRGKWLLRRLLYRYVPRELVDRPKMGFGVPIGSWLRGPLKDWAAALLDPRRLETEGFFHPEPIRQRWEEHLSGRRDWQYPLWDVLMFQAWLEQQKQPQERTIHTRPSTAATPALR